MKKLTIPIFFSIINLISSQYYDSGPIFDMNDYDNYIRTLDCWECFEANGKMCIRKDYLSMIYITGSSNYGHGICCKPGYNEGLCAPFSKDY